MALTEFQRKKLDKLEFSTDIEVADLLRMILDQIERGEIRPDGAIVILCSRSPDSQSSIHTDQFRAGMPVIHEIALLSAAHSQAITRWIGK